jgi:hypothetical protein
MVVFQKNAIQFFPLGFVGISMRVVTEVQLSRLAPSASFG